MGQALFPNQIAEMDGLSFVFDGFKQSPKKSPINLRLCSRLHDGFAAALGLLSKALRQAELDTAKLVAYAKHGGYEPHRAAHSIDGHPYMFGHLKLPIFGGSNLPTAKMICLANHRAHHLVVDDARDLETITCPQASTPNAASVRNPPASVDPKSSCRYLDSAKTTCTSAFTSDPTIPSKSG